MSDTESYIYRFSWDKEDLLQYHWKEHYVKQPEVLAYLNHVVERHDMRKNMQFNTQMTSAQFDESTNRWRIETSTNEVFTSKYLITALGLLSRQNYPKIPGLGSFRGEMYHTGNWPKSHDFAGKKVGVIGCGSTGVQVITAIAKEVKQLVCFQRHPQYSVPSGDGPVSKEYRESINGRYNEIWGQVRNSIVAFGFEESKVKTFDVSPEERERIYQDAWDKGNGFRFMFYTFCDITYDEAANEEACKFIRRKIAETVKDPEKASKLTPHDFYARRPLCDGGYYEQFNRDHVDIVDLKENPIEEITEKGIKTSDGKLHELDVIIFATGFDAVDGNYTRIAIKGRGGQSLKVWSPPQQPSCPSPVLTHLQEHWHSGPTSYLGCTVPNFPNLFMITGPNGPFTNIPPAIETHVEFISDAIAKAEKDHAPIVEATPEAEEKWTQLCKDMSAQSLFKRTDSWIFGANVPGKTNSVMFYFGGMKAFREQLQQCVDDGYKGFKPF
jgi:cyclohexanone monooxygenase